MASIMVGIPFVLQMLSTAFGRITGGDDDKRRRDEDGRELGTNKDDKWFTWQNEAGQGAQVADITPFLRAMSKVPGVQEFKRAFPTLGGWIPALTGLEETTGHRRYYARMGKQGWEVAGWWENPVKSFLGKMSMPAQRILEGILGVTPGTGMETEWKNSGFWERWTTFDPGKSASLNLMSAFLPFTVMGTYRNSDAGFFNAVMPVRKGTSKTVARNEMAKVLIEWAESDGLASDLAGRPRGPGKTDMKQMTADWYDALRINGYNPSETLISARTDARAVFYERLYKALPKFKEDPGNRLEAERAARALYRLNSTAADMARSFKNRDEGKKITRVGEFKNSTDRMRRWASTGQYGQDAYLDTREAANGGSVSGMLGNDDVPETVLGFTVAQPNEEDMKFFTDNPEAAGFYDLRGYTGGKTNEQNQDQAGQPR